MVLFLAFSLQDQVEKYGAYVGIAAFFGLAVLSLLYFSQARELKRLRDWAGRAPERAAEVEARVTAQASEVLRDRAAPAAATAGGARAASSVANGPATQVVETTEAEEAAAAQSGNGTTHAAEVAEHGATATDPDSMVETTEAGEAAQIEAEPEHEPPAEPEAAEEPPGAEAAEAEPAEEPAAGTLPEAPGEAVAREAPPEAPAVTADDEAVEVSPAGEAAQTGEEPEIPAAPVPRATPLPRRAPAPAAALRQPGSSATIPPPRRPAPARLAAGGGDSHSVRNGLLAGLGLVAILIGVLFATGVLGGSDDPTPNANRTSESGTATDEPSSSSSGSTAEPALTPKSTKVAVLNGTTIGGLASTEADKLRTAGYTGKLTTGNNTDQQRAESSVLYGTRDGARSQARTVARKLEISSVQRMDADTRDLSENADVVVVLGQDKAP